MLLRLVLKTVLALVVVSFCQPATAQNEASSVASSKAGVRIKSNTTGQFLMWSSDFVEPDSCFPVSTIDAPSSNIILKLVTTWHLERDPGQPGLVRIFAKHPMGKFYLVNESCNRNPLSITTVRTVDKRRLWRLEKIRGQEGWFQIISAETNLALVNNFKGQDGAEQFFFWDASRQFTDQWWMFTD